jgi:hypothetical protein
MADRKPILLRLDPAVHDALARWAADELRSTNAQIEMVLRRGLADAGRLPASLSPLRGPGRPRKGDALPGDHDDARSTDASGSTDVSGSADVSGDSGTS